MIDTPSDSPLFAPLRIGGVTVPNRIMQTAHSKQYSDRVESDRETAYFVRRRTGRVRAVHRRQPVRASVRLDPRLRGRLPP